jgi:hypothetical protein
MLPLYHLFLGIIFSLILFFLFPQIELIGFLIIILSTVLIDIDHYLYYIYKKKDLSLKNAYNWFVFRTKKLSLLSRKQRNEFYQGFAFLHGFETLLILFLIGYYFFWPIIYIFLGVAFHLFLDIFHQKTVHDRFDKYSIIYDYFKYKKLKLIDEFKSLID